MIDRGQTARKLTALSNPVFEIRTLPSKKSGFFDDTQKAVDAAESLTGAGENVYVTINEINPGRFTVDNQIHRGTTGGLTSNSDVTRLRHLLLDIDPKRVKGASFDAANVKGIACATDEEKQHAQTLADKALARTKLMGWPEPMRVDSGNGFYLVYKLDLPNTPEMVALVKASLAEFSSQLDNEHAKIDKGVSNPGRIIRLAGTVNYKGKDTTDRPHRPAKLISVPEAFDIITEDQLRAFAMESVIQQTTTCFVDSVEDSKLQTENVNAVLEFLDKAEVEHKGQRKKEDGTVVIDLLKCTKPNNNEDGNPGILISPGGVISYKCQHTKCSDVTWKKYQRHIGCSFNDLVTRKMTGEKRVVFDPTYLAEVHLKNTATTDESKTFVFLHGDLYRYHPASAWTTTKDKDIGPFLLSTAQKVFDEHARRGGDQYHIGTRLQGDVSAALKSKVALDVPPDKQPPFWLDDTDVNTDDLLPLRNDVLNLRKFVSGEPFRAPRSPNLFHKYFADFDYTSNTAEPKEWLAFLDSLGQDQAWRDCLQQIMGYILWPAYDLHKYFILVGPTRSGKGTIAGVLKDFSGGEDSSCGIEWNNFTQEFGLEKILGKRLLLMPEMDIPEKSGRQCVSKLKALTGGDMVSVNRKHRSNISVNPKTKIIIQTNNFVALPDESGALNARALPLKFTRSFLGQEDRELPDKLKLEYPLILNWSLAGLKTLYANDGRFTMPESSTRELNQLKEASSPVQTFVQDCCIVDTTRATPVDSLYEAYKSWLSSNSPGEQPPTMTKFGTELRAAVSTVHRDRATANDPTECRGCTVYPQGIGRPYLWYGIQPTHDALAC